MRASRNLALSLSCGLLSLAFLAGVVSPVQAVIDAQLKSALPAGFSSAIWGQSAGINNGYPYLLGNPPQ